MKISQTGRPSFQELKRKVSNSFHLICIDDVVDTIKMSISFVVMEEYFFYLPLLGTLGGSLKKMAKNIIPEVATSRNV